MLELQTISKIPFLRYEFLFAIRLMVDLTTQAFSGRTFVHGITRERTTRASSVLFSNHIALSYFKDNLLSSA